MNKKSFYNKGIFLDLFFDDDKYILKIDNTNNLTNSYVYNKNYNRIKDIFKKFKGYILTYSINALNDIFCDDFYGSYIDLILDKNFN